MRRRKRVAIVRIALAVGLVAVFVPTVAQAKPLPRAADDDSQRQGMPVYVTGSLSPDDRSFERTTGERVVIPYLSQGQLEPVNSPDDRPYSRAPGPGTAPTTSGDGFSIDVNPYAVTGFAIALMLAIGMVFAVRHNRRTKLLSA